MKHFLDFKKNVPRIILRFLGISSPLDNHIWNSLIIGGSLLFVFIIIFIDNGEIVQLF
jgi:hypothetical protein